jgi:hypothetical protein
MTDANASGYKHSGRPFPRTNWLAYGLGPPAARSGLDPILSTAARNPSQQRRLVGARQSLLGQPGRGG